MTRERIALLVAGIAAAVISGPGAAQSPAPAPAAAQPRVVDLPPITARPSGQRLPGKVVWFDLLTLDPAAAKPFYAGVLGWTFEERDGYAIAKDGATPVAGILQMPAPKPGAATPQARWVPLVSVANMAGSIAAVQQWGGRVMEGPGSLGSRGRYAAVADPRGAQFVLLSAAGGDPLDADAPPPGWIWAELWTDDLTGSASFYRAVIGYDTWQVGAGKAAAWIYASGGRPRARASRMPFEKVPAQWLPYVVVKDLKGSLARVTELGGKVLRSPEEKGAQFAVVSDPGGATFILEQRPEQPAGEVARAAPAAGGTEAPPPPPPPPPPTPDPFGIEAAQQKSQDEAAAQAAARQQGVVAVPGGDAGADVVAVVPAPSPYVNFWIAPPAWGPYWGAGWIGAPYWGGAPWWGYPPAWGPVYAPPYYPGRPPYNPGPQPYYPGYRPPPPRSGTAPPPRPAPRYTAPASRSGVSAPTSAPYSPSRAAPAPAPRSAPAASPPPARSAPSAPPAPRR